jgi:hypothetical protein
MQLPAGRIFPKENNLCVLTAQLYRSPAVTVEPPYRNRVCDNFLNKGSGDVPGKRESAAPADCYAYIGPGEAEVQVAQKSIGTAALIGIMPQIAGIDKGGGNRVDNRDLNRCRSYIESGKQPPFDDYLLRPKIRRRKRNILIKSKYSFSAPLMEIRM